jgi:mannose-6-phosphate isomerase
LVGTRDPQWAAQVDDIAQLALDHLISEETGAISEYFDLDWQPCPILRDTVVEPGHQFEWSWLLGRWAALRGSDAGFAAALRLAEIGECHGVDSVRGVAINALDGELSSTDRKAKPWPQTERIKAWHGLAWHPMNTAAGRVQAAARISAAIAGLELFLDRATPGLWHEQMLEDASFDLQPVRASTFYHVTCAIHTVSQPVAIQQS